ncbi:uncharacterized protein L969DRAFT_95897 [Mixia osmundae IAM 14324]|uniref:Opsin-1 n=1 Tax=Mixia osmundae (strain CBS 9802 / IAM 14324 / JCM 22182 / KY 12970) TaxID=764103 RepID=G7DX39_MIXOS|nr:uncharacterized protein L969DRAFT_95897 [Mixia osmundae IAM 14324]KEI38056.1 hypothetical protein L969DRAFT_95897 [Mixia osmundae IAM 14324]GAA95136.1 hypothetical protein E5Q_01791 [Mixia osmundae IAM 14324]
METILAQGLEAFKKHNDPPSIPDIPHLDGLVRITEAGKRTLWITFVVMAVASLIFLLMSFRQPAKARIFHHVTFFITATAAVSYYCMASGMGNAIIKAPGNHAFREVYYARYLDWLITTPLLLLDCCLLAGVPAAEIVLIILADIGMILTGLLAGVDDGRTTRWGLFTISCLFFLYVLWGLLFSARNTAFGKSDRVGKLYLGIAVYTAVLWIAYPVVWAFAEGTNSITGDTEVLAYAILDIAAKAVFGGWLLLAHENVEETKIQLPNSWVTAPNSGYGRVSQQRRMLSSSSRPRKRDGRSHSSLVSLNTIYAPTRFMSWSCWC